MKYVLALLLALTTQVNAAKGDKCIEPEWLGICEQVQEHVAGQLEIKIEIVKQKKGWVRFNAYCTNKELDPVYGYAKYIMGNWKLITFGTAITEEDCNQLGIPEFIR